MIDVEVVEKASQNQELQRTVSETDWLSESEKYALDYFKKNYCKGDVNSFPLAPSLQEKLFTLFLNGKSFAEIRKINPNLSLGQIVFAAVDGKWNQQRQEYLATLLEKSRQRLQQVACEGVSFVADQLSAAHKMYGDNLQRYLQSGNPADLGGFGVTTHKQYRDACELLLKLTGQDKQSTINNKGEILHTHVVSPSQDNQNQSLRDLASAKKGSEKK